MIGSLINGFSFFSLAYEKAHLPGANKTKILAALFADMGLFTRIVFRVAAFFSSYFEKSVEKAISAYQFDEQVQWMNADPLSLEDRKIIDVWNKRGDPRKHFCPSKAPVKKIMASLDERFSYESRESSELSAEEQYWTGDISFDDDIGPESAEDTAIFDQLAGLRSRNPFAEEPASDGKQALDESDYEKNPELFFGLEKCRRELRISKLPELQAEYIPVLNGNYRVVDERFSK